MQFLNAVRLSNLHYWKNNKSPKHTTGFTRLGNATFLVSHVKLTPIPRNDVDQTQHHPDTAGATRRLVLPSSFTQPRNYTRNEAHLLPATLPRTHSVVGGSGGAQQGLLQGHGLPEHPEPQRVSLDKRCSPFPTEPSQPRSYAPFLLRTPQVSTDGGSLLSLPTQDIHTPFDFKMLWGEFLCVWAGRRAAGEGVPPSFLFAQTLQ